MAWTKISERGEIESSQPVEIGRAGSGRCSEEEL